MVIVVVMVENMEIESFLLQLVSFDINKHQVKKKKYIYFSVFMLPQRCMYQNWLVVVTG